MPKTRIIGDVHGLVSNYKLKALKNFNGPSIQVGDLGVGFAGDEDRDEYFDKIHKNGNHRFIRGNHDNPEVCKKIKGYIQDGTIEDDVMFIGGAWSIDGPNAPWGSPFGRVEYIDWWKNEECSDDQFKKFLSDYQHVKPRVMITHDCPAKVSKEMFFGSGLRKGSIYKNKTSGWLDEFIKVHQPDFWFFGHWHISYKYKYGNTYFVCLGELDFIDVDLKNSEKIHKSVSKGY